MGIICEVHCLILAIMAAVVPILSPQSFYLRTKWTLFAKVSGLHSQWVASVSLYLFAIRQ